MILDNGRLFAHMVPAREYDRQASLTALEAMDLMGYNAALLTVDEFRYGLDFLKEALAKPKFTFLSCNLAWKANDKLLAKPYLIIEADGMKVGVIGVSADQDYSVFLKTPEGQLKQDDNVLDVLQEVKVLDPFESLGETLREIERQVNVVIVLSSLRDQDNPKLAKQYPQINLILTDTKLDDLLKAEYEKRPEPRGPWQMYLKQGDTYIVEGSRTVLGQLIGRLELTFRDGKLLSITPLWTTLPEEIPDDPQVRALLAKFYERVAKEENLQTPPKPIFGNNPVDSDPTNSYVGNIKCGSCHQAQKAQWEKIENFKPSHVDAFRSLLRRQPPAHYNPNCVICHTVGFGRPSGFTIAKMQVELRGVGCEVCHGPGAKHVAKQGKGNIRRTLTTQQCLECHTPEQMKEKYQDFVDHFPDYLAKVKH